MKKFLIYFLILIPLFGCESAKEGFTLKKKNNSDEFLVEKKSPLSMPPDFDELPIPQNNNEDNKGQSKDIELLITENDKSKSSSTEIENSDKDFLKLILDKIKKN